MKAWSLANHVETTTEEGMPELDTEWFENLIRMRREQQNYRIFSKLVGNREVRYQFKET